MIRFHIHPAAICALALAAALSNTIGPAHAAEDPAAEGPAAPPTDEASIGGSWCLTPAFNRSFFAQPLRLFDGIVTEVDTKNRSVKVATEFVTLAPDKNDAKKLVPEKQTKILKMTLAVTGSVVKVTRVTVQPAPSGATAQTVSYGEEIDLAELKVGQQVSVTVKLPTPQVAPDTSERRLIRFFGPLQIEEAAMELTAQTISFAANEN